MSSVTPTKWLRRKDRCVIDANRFVISKDMDESWWLQARRDGVTATQVSRADAGEGSFRKAVEDYEQDWIETDNPFMKFGRDWEPIIALQIKRSHGIMPNSWLIRHVDQPRHLATPDGLSIDHETISEIKTTGKDWGDGKIPIQCRRQVQWQLHVTGARQCVFAWMQRVGEPGNFAPAWFDAKVMMMDRDEQMINKLIATANKLWGRVQNG